MTELFLNKYRAVLDKSFTAKVVYENPYFTQSSTYTYNVTLPLAGCVQNQLIFKHINRDDVSKHTQTLAAILISDDICMLNGTAVVMEITDENVKVQLLSGNSELNFYSTDDKFIDEFDLGKPLFKRIAWVNNYFDQYWGSPDQINSVFFPIFNEDAEEIYNRIKGDYVEMNGVKNEGLADYYPNQTKNCIQPYLCHIITKVVEALGYNLIENQIENTIFKYLFVCNATVVNKIEAVLPHWTVNEFFSQIEKTFGVVIVVDEGNKTVKLIMSHEFFESSRPVCLKKITDSFTAKIDPEETTDLHNANIGYNLSDSESFKIKKLDEDVIKNTTIKEYDSINELQNDYNSLSNPEKGLYIFQTDYRQFIRYSGSLKEVNQLRDLKRNPDKADPDIELKIVPVGMTRAEVEVYDIRAIRPTLLWTSTILIPSMQGSVFSYGGEEPSIEDRINGEISKKYKPETIQVAFNHPELNIISSPDGETHLYPMAFTDYSDSQDAGITTNFPRWSLRFTDASDAKCIGSEIFDKAKKINTTVEETKRFISHIIHDPKSVFIANNKKYVCKKIEVEIKCSGIVPLQEATMYELLE